ncbi:MAG: sigma-70 family RNA polymerase sigma factor [Bacteroidia bacterium]
MTDSHNIDEQELLRLLTAGDKKGMEALYDRYAAVIYGVIYRITGRDDLSEEILIETFLKIFKNSSQYDPARGRFLSWMIGLARNISLEKIRLKDFQQNINPGVRNDVLNTDSHLSFDAELSSIRDVIRRLDPEYRSILELLYFSGKSPSEIAAILNIPLGTVKSRVKAAFSKLRNYFDAKQI